jgi:hypothetical protein
MSVTVAALTPELCFAKDKPPIPMRLATITVPPRLSKIRRPNRSATKLDMTMQERRSRLYGLSVRIAGQKRGNQTYFVMMVPKKGLDRPASLKNTA